MGLAAGLGAGAGAGAAAGFGAGAAAGLGAGAGAGAAAPAVWRKTSVTQIRPSALVAMPTPTWFGLLDRMLARWPAEFMKASWMACSVGP